MVAPDTPLKIIESARGTLAAGTSRMTIAVDMAQKPPSATPSSKRPIRSTVRPGAVATIRLEITRRPEKIIIR